MLTGSGDYEIQFDPLIGSNNEAFYAGFGSADVPIEPGECEEDDADGRCAAEQE